MRSSGFIKEISTNSLRIRKLNRKKSPVKPFNFRMRKEFVLISFIKPEERKTLNKNFNIYIEIEVKKSKCLDSGVVIKSKKNVVTFLFLDKQKFENQQTCHMILTFHDLSLAKYDAQLKAM